MDTSDLAFDSPANPGLAEDSRNPGNEARTQPAVQQLASHAQTSRAIFRLLNPISALIATIALQQIVYQSVSSDNYLFRMLRLNESVTNQIVPAAIIVLFLWTVFDLTVSWRRTRASRFALRGEIIANLPRKVQSSGPGVANKELSQLPTTIKRQSVIAHLRALLENLASIDNSQRAHEAFKHQSELMARTEEDKFSAPKTFIWAMPILGFIGTVLGIGLAVGEFSSFLTTSIDDVDLVKNELSKIAAGLSYAFDTTLLGLLASLPAMLYMAYVQRMDSLLAYSFENLGLAIISSCKKAGFERVVNPALPNIDTELLHEVRTGLSSLASVQKSLADNLTLVGASSESLVTTLTQVTEGQSVLGRALVDLGREVEDVQRTAKSSLVTLTDAVDEAVKRMASIGIADASVVALTGNIDEVITTLNTLVKKLENNHDEAIRNHLEQVIEQVKIVSNRGTKVGQGVQQEMQQIRSAMKEVLGYLNKIGSEGLNFHLSPKGNA